MGSVHYGARTAPAHVGPAVRAGAVRSEHYAGRRGSGVPTAILTEAIISGAFPRDTAPSCSATLSITVTDSLPFGYQLVVLNGITYYLFNGVYYQPYIYGGQTVYLVVPTQ